MSDNTTALTRRTLLAASFGTILEWYDFSLFGFLTPIIATVFFPGSDQFTALMFTYGIFAVGFFSRPVGAAIFGHYGDRLGRKKMLIYSIVLMTAPTVLIGLLPSAGTLSYAAPIALLLLRLCQGIAAGGEATGALLFVVESKDYKYRGFMAAVLWSVVGVGMLLGSFASMLVMQFPQYPWAWRIPFILGIFTGAVGYFVRRKIPEPKLFQKVVENKDRLKFPLLQGFQEHKQAMFTIIAIYTLSGIITYLIFIFMPHYATSVVGLPAAETSLICTLGLAAVTGLVMASGFASDLIGRRKCLGIGAGGFLLLSLPAFWLINKGDLSLFAFVEALFVILAALFQGTINATVVELVPTHSRYSMVAVGYNLSYSLFGGTAPLIATYLVKATGNPLSPALYLMFGALVACIAVYFMPETSRRKLS